MKKTVVALIHCFVSFICSSPITIPLKDDSSIHAIIPDYFESKIKNKAYYNATPNFDLHANKLDDLSICGNSLTDISFKLNWKASTGSSSPIYSTPVIFPDNKGNKQIFINTFYNQIELIDKNGYSAYGWPILLEESSFHSSPILYDIDNDHNIDIGAVDRNGNIFWIRINENSEYLEDYHIIIPKLKVKKDWYAGMDPAFIDNYVLLSMFDHKNNLRHHDDPESTDNQGDSNNKVKVHNLKSLKKTVANSESQESNDEHSNINSRRLSEEESQAQNNEQNIQGINDENANNNHNEIIEENQNQEANRNQQVEPSLSTNEDHPINDNHEELIINNNNENSINNINNNDNNNRQNGDVSNINVNDNHHEEENINNVHNQDESSTDSKHNIDNSNNNNNNEPIYVFDADEDHKEINRDNHDVHINNEDVHNVEKDTNIQAEQPVNEHQPDAELNIKINDNDHIENIDEEHQEFEQNKIDFGDNIMETDDYEARRHSFRSVGPASAYYTPREPEPFDNNEDNNRVDGEDNLDTTSPTSTDPIGRSYGRTAQNFDYGGLPYYSERHAYGMINESNFVFIDAHVLSTPALVDINGDGHMEMVFAVSYYFDKAEYVDRSGIDFDIEMYVAGGVVCWDMQSQDWTWMVHLDLTTAKSKFQAMIYASPTVADLDGDGRFEVIIGTSLGLLYLMDGDSGFVRRFFPMQFHSIQAQIVVGNVYGDSKLEMVVVDMGGTVAVVTIEGDVIWDRQLSGSLPFTPTLGDINGDGILDIIIVSVWDMIHQESSNSTNHNHSHRKSGAKAHKDTICHIWILRGDTGEPLPGYPISLPNNAQISSSAIVTNLNIDKTNQNNKGLHLIVSSFDGHIYVIDANQVIVNNITNKQTNKFNDPKKHIIRMDDDCTILRLDVGEHIYSVPLIDDISGDGYLDLLIGTLNGQLLLFESNVPYSDTSNIWTSFPNHRSSNVFTSSNDGIFIPQDVREKLVSYEYKTKHKISLRFVIIDSKYDNNTINNQEYTVSVTRGTNRLEPIVQQVYTAPGEYVITFRMNAPESSLFILSMTNKYGQYYEDFVHISNSVRFYIWLKYMIISPMVVLCIPLLLHFIR
eukprot:gene5673-7830_t